MLSHGAQVTNVEQPNQHALSLHGAAVYRIRLQGHLDQTWAREVGMRIENSGEHSDTAVATLIGELPDQATLFGVLNRLYGLGYPLLSVDCLYPTAVSHGFQDPI